MPAVISDSSPLIYLQHLGRFEFLRKIYTTLLVPPAVWLEVGEHGGHRAEGRALRTGVEEGWITVVAASGNPVSAELLALGAGEREAIQLAYEREALLLIDEARGREIAMRLGVNLTGTLGVLVEAKKKGMITQVRPELDRLAEETTFRVSERVRQHILLLAGELA